jgi:branched-chain amino acid transport system substrate-binding protein
MPMVSPVNSSPELTRTSPGGDPSLPASLYPTGHRNFVRVYPTDDLQGAALALFARDRGRMRVFVLDDGSTGGYGAILASGFETSARRLGLRVVGRASWDPRARSYAGLADRVARSRPQAVFVSGILDSNAARVIRDLRVRLGRSVDVLAPDGLTPVSLFVAQAGRSAFGVHVSLAGIVRQTLPSAGRRFLRRFGQTQEGVTIDPFAVYAAQATEVLVDAIARSDGTRPSIVRELFDTRVRNGLLGSFTFDANGDSSESPITIVRVRQGGGSTAVGSFEGAVVERVVRPSSKLVAPEQ